MSKNKISKTQIFRPSHHFYFLNLHIHMRAGIAYRQLIIKQIDYKMRQLYWLMDRKTPAYKVIIWS